MRALWAMGCGTVHQIRSQLLPRRPLAYTTVMTLMMRLARKGVVEREMLGRAHLYRPVIAEQAVLERALARLVEVFFSGSRERLAEYVSARDRISLPVRQPAEGRAADPSPRRPEFRTTSLPAAPELAESGPAEIDPSLL